MRSARWMLCLALSMPALTANVRAQDVPGIEICTVEKTMERRTSCLQSNVDFLIKTIGKASSDSQQRLDAANRQIDALKTIVAGLQSRLQALEAKPLLKEPAKEPAKETAKEPAAK